MQFKVSVVIPTYKRPALLRNCLTCLKQQDLPAEDFEVLVVSDGPDKETEAMVQQMDGNIHFIQLHKKQGPAAARNLGWKNAHGHLVAFTDDDCLPSTNWLSAFCKEYNGEELLVMTGQVRVPVEPPVTDYKLNIANLEKADFITANCCCTKAALYRVNGFDERFSMAWREDSDLEFKFIQEAIPIKYKIPALVTHPVRKASWGVSLKEQKKSMFNALLYKKYPELYRRRIADAIPFIFYLMVIATIIIITGWMIDHQPTIIVASMAWLLCYLSFLYRRLKTTSKEIDHVFEMMITSIFIPYLSIYWNYYGWLKYRARDASSSQILSSSHE